MSISLKNFLSLIFTALLFFSGCTNEETERIALSNRFQLKLDSLREVTGFPGATLAVIIGDSEFQLASGVADIGSGIPMKPDNRMFTGSVGKTFVSAVALQLVHETRLSLDDPISKFFQHDTWFSKLKNGSEITVRMLMNHTSGLPRYVLKTEFWDDMNNTPDKVWAPEELLSYILDDEPVHQPGNGWSYSDSGYIILGMIIEKIFADTYYSELSKRILIPYGLENTTPSISREIPGLAAGYTGEGAPPFNLPGEVISNGIYVINPQFEWTGGGLVSTSMDLAKWAKYLFTGNVLPDYLRAELMSPVSESTGQPDTKGYGLGVQVWETDGGLIYGHGGIFPGYLTQIYYIPQFNAFMAIQINTDTLSGKLDRSIGRILAALIPVIQEHLQVSQ